MPCGPRRARALSRSALHPNVARGQFAVAAVAAGSRHQRGPAVHALGIRGSQAGGIIDPRRRSWTERLHPGWAADAGVVAVLLTQSVFTGPATVSRARASFYRVLRRYDAAPLDAFLDPRTRVGAVRATFKPPRARLHRRPVHGLRASSPPAALPACADRRGPLPHREALPPLGAARREAPPTERITASSACGLLA